ncbi:MAG: chorismate synthase [Candidatus Eremiobacteraeota bacterium]|nr:chorismate synthase [Candidatus Eremiobacteraeota bacterium]
MRILYSGESHMEAVIAVIEGFPAGFHVDVGRINRDLAMRQDGYGRGDRMKIESDRVEIYSGIINGMTIGSPITLVVRNKDVRRESWNPEDRRTIPRPGHADFAGATKYGLDDFRLVAERASARQTASWVAAGSLFTQFLEEIGIEIIAFVESIGDVKTGHIEDPFVLKEKIESSPFRIPDPGIEDEMKSLVDRTKEDGDSLGGVFCVVARGCPAGLGSYNHPDRRLDAMLASAFMGIPSAKGVEIGAGFKSAGLTGSGMNDGMEMHDGKVVRKTNNAGGIEGGVSNGEDIIVRCAAKPIPTVRRKIPSIDFNTETPADSPYIRADVCVLPAMSVIGESVMATVLCKSFLERYGCDNMELIRRNFL